MVEPHGGDARKIVGVAPKFFIEDDGTTYITGEEYNGLWSGGTLLVPTGYACIGHWKLNEDVGIVGFNNRVRGQNDFYMEGVIRSSDAVGTYISFRLANNEPLVSPSPYYFLMMGTGGSYVKTTQWANFLKTPGFENILGDIPDGTVSVRYMFDIWVYARKPPQNSGDYQVLFYLHNHGVFSIDKILRFDIFNQSGVIELRMSCVDTNAGGSSFVAVRSSTAGNAIYPEGLSQDGGLHHISFIIDRTVLFGGYIKFAKSEDPPEGFYVDGKYYALTAGNTNNWHTGTQKANVNAFIGCELDGTNPPFSGNQVDGPKFSNHFTGKIYQASMTQIVSAGEISETRMRILHSLRFDIPRGPTPVDFSQRYEFGGKNLLQEIASIKQSIESDRGHFFVTIQKVKARN